MHGVGIGGISTQSFCSKPTSNPDRILRVPLRKVTISNHPDVEHIHTSYHIAQRMGFLNQSFIKKAEGFLHDNLQKYVHKYIGGWLERLDGCIITNWREGTFDDSLPYVLGMDFGYTTDPTCLVKIAIDEGLKKMYVKSVFYEQHLSTGDIIELLKDHVDVDDTIIADRQEARLINDIESEGFNIIPCVKGPDSVRKGLKDLQDYELIVDPADHDTKIELNHYIWKTSGIPIDDFNHIIDSIRYVLQWHNEKPNYSFA